MNHSPKTNENNNSIMHSSYSPKSRHWLTDQWSNLLLNIVSTTNAHTFPTISFIIILSMTFWGSTVLMEGHSEEQWNK